jgi:hypothetical protein
MGMISIELPASETVFDQSDIDSLILLPLLLPPPPPPMLDFSVSGGRRRSPSSF